MEQTFGRVNLEQFLYHLDEGYEGLKDADSGLIASFVLTCVVAPVVLLATAPAALRLVRRIVGAREVRWKASAIARLAATAHRYGLTALLAVLCSAYLFLDSLYVFDYQRLARYANFIDRHYVEPRSSGMTSPARKRNLVLIYVESLETSYRNPTPQLVGQA